jgi:gliding motility-associated lipoprotein GldH
MQKILLLLAIPILLQTACQSKYSFEEQKDIPDGQWTYPDTLDFRFTIADTSQMYNLYLDIGYADIFSTQNLYLQLHTLFPDGTRLSKQVSIDLFDAQGVPQGKCSGHTCRYPAMLQENAFFNQPGAYVITVAQHTRRDSLPGILSVGLALEPVGKRGR